MDFVISGFAQSDLEHMRAIIDALKEKMRGESDQRIVKMALNRMYLDIFDPPFSDEWPTPEELRQMNGGKDPPPVTEEHRKLAGKAICAFLAKAQSDA